MYARTLVLISAAAAMAGAETRFGRKVLAPADPAKYEYQTIDELKVPALANERFSVRCLAYRGDGRHYLELGIKNLSGRETRLADDFVSLTRGVHPLRRIDTLKVAEKIEGGAVRAFSPTPSGRDPKTGEPIYDRAEVARQRRKHLEKQESEALFAGLLLSLCPESPMPALRTGEERNYALAFEDPGDPRNPVDAVVRIGDDEFRFRFK